MHLPMQLLAAQRKVQRHYLPPFLVHHQPIHQQEALRRSPASCPAHLQHSFLPCCLLTFQQRSHPLHLSTQTDYCKHSKWDGAVKYENDVYYASEETVSIYNAAGTDFDIKVEHFFTEAEALKYYADG